MILPTCPNCGTQLYSNFLCSICDYPPMFEDNEFEIVDSNYIYTHCECGAFLDDYGLCSYCDKQ